MKKFTFLFLFVLIGAWSTAEAADIKLKYRFSQDMTYARDTDLNKGDDNNPIATRGNFPGNVRGKSSGDAYSFFSTLLGINAQWTPLSNTEIVADMVAQFDWHGSNGTVFPHQTAVPGQGQGTYGDTGSTTAIGFGFKELYLKLADLLDWPIDLKVGRQDIKLGRGFVVDSWLVGSAGAPYENGRGPSGSGLTGGGSNGQHFAANTGNLPINAPNPGALYAPEQSAFDAFDAVTAKVYLLDNKLNIDLGYALIAGAFSEAGYRTAGGAAISDRNIGTRDSEHLYFANLGYTWKVLSGLLTEAYAVVNIDDEPTLDNQLTTAQIKGSKVYTLGARGDWNWGKGFLGLKNINTYIEAAHQRGDLGGDNIDSNIGRKRSAYAANLGSDIALNSTSKWLPSLLKLEAIVLSGEEPNGLEDDDQATNGTAGTAGNDVGSGDKWKGYDWQFMGPAFWYAKIMPFLDVFYLTDVLSSPADAATAPIMGKQDAGLTNRWVLRAKADFDLTKKLLLSLNAAYAQALQIPSAGLTPAQRKFGQEIDWDLVYKLSKVTDVTFDGGVLLPGSYYKRIPLTGRRTPAAYLLRLGFKVDLG
ncbi:MAG: hypothetical protein HYY62_00885 [Deltaproteobacteria bacterium]|nr:hypothetical protein [Deltaproteobacteria bacterium]